MPDSSCARSACRASRLRGAALCAVGMLATATWAQGVSLTLNRPSSLVDGAGGVADLDGDGRVDLIAPAAANASNFYWLRNAGGFPPVFAPTLLESTGFGGWFSPPTGGVRAADMDGDGDLDLVYSTTSTSQGAPGSIRWAERTEQFPAGWVQRFIKSTANAADFRLVDLTEDGHMDVIAVERPVSGGDPVGVYLYTNDGQSPPSFSKRRLSSSSLAISIDVGDLNGDGKLDYVTGNNRQDFPLNYHVQTSGSTGSALTFQFRDVFTGTDSDRPRNGYRDVSIIDADGDGVAEILGVNNDSGNFTSKVDLYVADAGGEYAGTRLRLVPALGSIASARTSAILDIDGDEDLDVVVSCIVPRSLYVLRNDSTPGAIAFSLIALPTTLDPAENVDRLLVADVDGDLDPDVVQGSYWLENTIVRNVTSGQEFARLADAIAAASSGDEIVADPGAFRDTDLDLVGKALRLRSTGAVVQDAGSTFTLAGGATFEASPGEAISLGGALAIPAGADVGLVAAHSSISATLDLAPSARISASGDLVLEPKDTFERVVIDERSVAGDVRQSSISVLGDLNGDGVDDFVSTRSPFNGSDARVLYISSGPGTYGAPTAVGDVVWGSPGDVDGDGLVDVYRLLSLEWRRNLGTDPVAFGPVEAMPTPFPAGQLGLPDFNGDGLADAVLSNGTDVLVDIQQPDGSFVRTTAGASVFAEGQPIPADLDGDGDLDLVLPSAAVDWLENTTDTAVSFAAGPDIAGTTLGRFVRVRDFDGDGDLDIVGTLGLAESDRVIKLWTNGGGSPPHFQRSDLPWVSPDPIFVLEAADIDGDGDADLTVGYDAGFTNEAVALRNDGGSPAVFAPIEFPAGDTYGNGGYVGDVDGDGIDDVIIATSGEDGPSTTFDITAYAIGDKTAADLGAAGTEIAAAGRLTVAGGAVDLGTDGALVAPDIDLVDPRGRTAGTIVVSGTGALVGDVQNGATIMVGPQGGATIGGNLTQSAMVPGIGSSRGGRIVYDGPSAVPSPLAVQGEALLGGVLLVTVPQETSQSPGTLISADAITGAFDAVLVSPALSGDRFLTVNYTTPRQGARMAGIVSLGVASLSGDPALAPPTGFPTPGAPADAVTARINDDDFDDVVLVIPGAVGSPGNLTLLISDGAGGFGQQVTVPTAIEPRGVAVGDIDQTGGLDIAVTGFGDNTVRLYSTDGLTMPAISPEVTLTVADLPLLSEPFDVVVGQFNGAGPDDVALTSSGSDIVYLLETKDPMMDPMTDPFEFEPCEVPAGTRPKGLAAAADLDGDLVADFVVGNTRPGVFGISAITSSGGFAVTTYPVGDEPGEVLLRDLNGDGAPDAAAVRPDGDVVSVLRNTGGGVFAPPADLPVGLSPRSLADADLDLDADVDLAVIVDNGGSRVVQVLRNDTQTSGQLVFAATEQIAVGASASLVRSGDLNADGRDDLLTLDGGAGVLRRATQDGNAVLLNPAPPSACVADLTTDGSSNGVPDGEVTLSDFSYYLSLWGAGDLTADVTSDGSSDGVPDGAVTLSDFSFFLSVWGAGCP